MFDNLDDFKKKAIDNKANLKFKNISIPIGDGEQDFRITGIGEKAIKIEKYVKYEDIETTIETLVQIFKGCPAMLLEAETDDFIEYSKALCCFKI